MTKPKTLLKELREEFESALIVSPLLAELAATGGQVIPRALFFTIGPDGDKKARISAMREPPTIPHFDMVGKAAFKELRELAEGGKGAVCVIYSAAKGLPGSGSPENSGIALLHWQATDGSQQLMLMRPGKNGESVDMVEVDQSRMSVVSGMIEATIAIVGRPESLLDSVLDRMLPLLTPVIRALAPDAPDDDTAAEMVAENTVLLEALKDYASESVHMALGLSEARAETVLAHLSMTTGYLHAKMADALESHRDNLAKMRTNWERQQAKTVTKLQRELDMTRKRADSLSRQVQDARESLRKSGSSSAAPTSPATAAVLQEPAALPQSALQRRMSKYLGEFPAFRSVALSRTGA